MFASVPLDHSLWTLSNRIDIQSVNVVITCDCQKPLRFNRVSRLSHCIAWCFVAAISFDQRMCLAGPKEVNSLRTPFKPKISSDAASSEVNTEHNIGGICGASQNSRSGLCGFVTDGFFSPPTWCNSCTYESLASLGLRSGYL